jgi:hypothetical protein
MTWPQSGHAAHVAVPRAPPLKTGFQWNPIRIRTRPRTKNSWPLRRHAQLLAQLQQLDQRVRAIEHPDLGSGHRLLDFAPPLVDQVGWREHQRAAVAFGVEHGGRGNAHGRLAAAHLAIDDRGAFAAVDQQLGDGMDHIGLRGEQLALETRRGRAADAPGPGRCRPEGLARLSESSSSSPNSDTKSCRLIVREKQPLRAGRPAQPSAAGTTSVSRDMVMLQ